jgi:putative ABC transport system permease protein
MPKLRIFLRLFLRPLWREPLRTALTIFAVALGVAVVLAIDMAGNAATGSFLSSVQTLAGKADFKITEVGGVDASVVGRLARLPYALKIEPRIEDYAWDAKAQELVPIVGIDMVAEASSGTQLAPNLDRLSTGECVWVSRGLAQKPGDKVELQINDRTAELDVCGIIRGRSPAQGDAVVMDIGLAAQQFGRGDKVDAVLVTVPHSDSKTMTEWENILKRAVPAGVLVQRFGAQARENHRMLAAFRWNLRVLSYIALIVGAFLIYNNLSVSVVRRRAEIGVIRALGGSRRFIRAAFLGEALFYGLAGSLAGVVLGRLLAAGTVGLISTTVQSLYLTSQPASIAVTPATVLLGFIVGVGVALLSALLPAYEASQVAPVEAMARGRREYETRVRKGRLLGLAGLCAVAAIACSRMPALGGKPLYGYAAAMLLLGACVLSMPAVVAGLAGIASGILRRWPGAEGYLALHGLSASLRRTSVLLAALSTAVAMVVSVGIMVGSFRQTVTTWLGNDFMADLYVQPAVPISPDLFPTFSPDVPARIAALPQVEAIDELRAYSITYQGQPTTLASDMTRVAERYEHVEFLSGEDPRHIFNRLARSSSVVVSEPFAIQHGIHERDQVTLPLGGKSVSFSVAGIYYDYSDPRGAILMDRANLLRYLPDPAVSSIAVYLKHGVSDREARRSIEIACAGRRISIVSDRELRSQAIQVFDRTFTITYALEAIALSIAVIGVAGALLALVVDRRRELGVLRFLGSSTRQIRKLILWEAGLLGLLGCVAGFVLGVLLSLVLIFVIDKQSFGWSIQFHWPVAVLAAGLVVIYCATLAAGLYPARLAMNLNPIEVVHEE